MKGTEGNSEQHEGNAHLKEKIAQSVLPLKHMYMYDVDVHPTLSSDIIDFTT